MVVPTLATLSENQDTELVCLHVNVKVIPPFHVVQTCLDRVVYPAVDLWPEALNCMILNFGVIIILYNYV